MCTACRLFVDLLPDGSDGMPRPVTNAAEIKIRSHRKLYTDAKAKRKSVPEWVIFTAHGMACSICM